MDPKTKLRILKNTTQDQFEVVGQRTSSLPHHFSRLRLGRSTLFKPITSTLCHQCQQLEFLDPEYFGTKEFDTVFDYAKYERTNPKCPLCTLIMGRIPEYRLEEGLSPERVPIKLKTKGSLAHVWSGQRNYGRVYPLVNWEDYCRRQVDGQVKTDTIKAWLTECELHHENKKKPARKPMDLILVDVKHQCLVRERSDVEYFALSYVWGGAQTVQTTTSNLEDLSTPQAFRRRHQLPATLRDAIELTQRLNKQFIWIDSLCIVQDSPNKHDILAHMDVIYSHASLTIVAVDGHSVYAPLPGISPASRPAVMQLETINGRSFVSEPPEFLDTHILGCHYESRGWTFQERVLSSRLLYFSAQQVLFQCHHSSRLETERQPVVVVAGYINMGEFNPKADPVVRKMAVEKIGSRGGLLSGRQMSQLAQIVEQAADTPTRTGHVLARTTNEAPARVINSYHPPTTEQTRETIPPDIATASFKDFDKLRGGYAASLYPTSITLRAVTWKELLPLYQDMVELYTARHLTFKSDILRAFAGISSLFGRLGKSDFVNGLPSRMLAPTLLWVPATTTTISRRRIARHRMKLGDAALPSWSWAGWDGPVAYPSIFRDHDGHGPQFDMQGQVNVKEWESTVGDKNRVSVLCFKASTFEFRPTMLRKGVAPLTQNFAMDGSQQASGVIFETSLRVTARHDSFTSDPLDEACTAILLGTDEDMNSKYELRRKFGVDYERLGHKYRGRTVYILLVRRSGRFFERVGAGKMVKSALANVRCVQQLIELK